MKEREVVRVLYEDHVTAYTVRGVVSESLLHRHAGFISVISNESEEEMLSNFMSRPLLLLVAWNAAALCGIL